MNPPLAITACALLTPLDSHHQSTWEALVARRGIDASLPASRAVSDHLLVGDPLLDRSIRIALAAVRRAVPGPLPPETALFAGTSKGPVGTALDTLERLAHQPFTPLDPLTARQIALGPGAMAACLADHLRLRGMIHTSVAACASGLHALHRAANALWRGECSRALVVASDASLQLLFEASFKRLGVLSPRHTCVPFGDAGEGFFVTEAGAAILLEYPDQATATPLAFLEASWIGADGTGMIAVDAHTAALRHGLRTCIDRDAAAPPPAFVHAHATGTAHDRFERQAIRAVVGDATPILASKSCLGHSLGAAGLVSLALSAQCHSQGKTFAGHPLASAATSLTIAQGFGGPIAIIRLRSAAHDFLM